MDSQYLPVPIPRGIADQMGTTGYIVDSRGGIQAIALATGAVLWKSSEATCPLVVIKHSLAATRLIQSNVLQVVVLDTLHEGAVTLISDPVEFPDRVRIGTQDNENFRLNASATNDTLLLEWEAHLFYQGGAAPSAKVLQQTTRDATGRVQINLESGKVVMLPAEDETKTLAPLPAQEALPTSIGELESGAQAVTFVEDKVYYLVSQPIGRDMQRTVLKAKSLKSDKILWELSLEEGGVYRAAPALRR